MKIGVVTITYNDNYKLLQWCQHYKEYASDVFLHVIVDNGSSKAYVKQLHHYFPQSVILERVVNGGCTGAYNDGINYLLLNSDVDAVALVGNDIRLSQGALQNLYADLMSSPEICMVAPILLEGDSDIVADFGCTIKNYHLVPYQCGKKLMDVEEDIVYAQAVTGGINLAKRRFYMDVGLQDANLFMYCDEADMGLRAMAKNYKMLATKSACAWHQHINPAGATNRPPYGKYLISRNRVYLARKYQGRLRAYCVGLHSIAFGCGILIRAILKGRKHEINYGLWTMWGSLNGLMNNMKINKFCCKF